MNKTLLRSLTIPLLLTVAISVAHLLGYFYYPHQAQKFAVVYYTARSLICVYSAVIVAKEREIILWQTVIPTAIFLLLDQVLITGLGALLLIPMLFQLPPPPWTYVLGELSLVYVKVLPISLLLSLFAAYTYRKKLSNQGASCNTWRT